MTILKILTFPFRYLLGLVKDLLAGIYFGTRIMIRNFWRRSWKTIVLTLLISALVLTGALWTSYKLNSYLGENHVSFQTPVYVHKSVDSYLIIEFRNFVKIEPRLSKGRNHIAYAEKPQELWEQMGLISPEKEICMAFGEDCKMALAISQAENGTRQCDRIVIEPNNTVSIGLFMINSTHFKRFPASQLVTCLGNIEAAKQIFAEQGNWTAWSVFKNKSYLRFMR